MGGGHLDDRVVHWQRVHSIVLLPLVSKCPKTIEVCMWCSLFFMSVVVTVWVFVGMLGVLKYVCVRGVMDVVFVLCRVEL